LVWFFAGIGFILQIETYFLGFNIPFPMKSTLLFAMSRFFLNLCCLLMVCFGINACAWDKPEADPSKQGKNIPPKLVFTRTADTLVYADTTFLQTETGKLPKEQEQLAQIAISYPYFKKFIKSSVKDSLNKSIQAILLLDQSGTIAYKNIPERMNNFIEEYKTYADDMKVDGLPSFEMKWNCEVRIGVLMNTNNLLSLSYFESNFTGGAHANATTRYLNFDLRTGKQIELKDVLKANTLAEIQTKIYPTAEQLFYKHTDALGIPREEILFPNGNFYLPTDFALTPEGLLFAYNPYEIAAYATGVIELLIPYSEVYNQLNMSTLQ
jgi:hypothetical protein